MKIIIIDDNHKNDNFNVTVETRGDVSLRDAILALDIAHSKALNQIDETEEHA